MSEVTRGEIDDIIRDNATKDPNYRAALIKNPKKLLSMQLGREIPDWMNVKVVEETADTLFLVAPYVAPAEGDELSDSDLEQVSGGKGNGGQGSGSDEGNTYTCNDNNGMSTRVEVNTTSSVF